MSYSSSQGLKNYSLPVGIILPFAGKDTYTKDGWIQADGAEVAKADYPDLWAVCGTLWNNPAPVNPTLNFRIPNLNPVQNGKTYSLYPHCVPACTGDQNIGSLGDIDLQFTLTESNIPSFTTANITGAYTDITQDARIVSTNDPTGAYSKDASSFAQLLLPYNNPMTQTTLTMTSAPVFSRTAVPVEFNQNLPLVNCLPLRYEMRYFIKARY